jgi:hypothetical protein
MSENLADHNQYVNFTVDVFFLNNTRFKKVPNLALSDPFKISSTVFPLMPISLHQSNAGADNSDFGSIVSGSTST